VEKTLEHIRDWAKIGFKIDILVGEFGPRCLFVLHKPLTKAFLLRKITKTGRTHDVSIAHLIDIGLQPYIESNHLDVFGDAIINYLLRPLLKRRGLVQSRHMSCMLPASNAGLLYKVPSQATDAIACLFQLSSPHFLLNPCTMPSRSSYTFHPWRSTLFSFCCI
jgi:hypothetical protein